jgi:hypothetical protein
MYQFHQELHSSTLLSQENKLRSRSWVMTAPGDEGFIKLPNERILFTSPPRTSLQITTPNTFPGAQPFSARSDAGVVYITNQRLVYLPTTKTPELQSFSCPILNTQDTFVRAPFFGANYWTGLCKPVSGGGIPAAHTAVELRLTFREGGAFDFHTIFEQIKERLYQAYQVARETGQSTAQVNLNNVHLDQLPAYQAAEELEEEDGPPILSPVGIRPPETNSGVLAVPNSNGGTHVETPVATPDEPPPGYEEAQAQAVDIALDRTVREEAERQ